MIACDKKNSDVMFVDEVETENRSINGLVKNENFYRRKLKNKTKKLITQNVYLVIKNIVCWMSYGRK